MDALNQKDIDALLKGSAPATAPKPTIEVIPYNFLRPPRISRERRATLEGIYGRLAVALQPILASRLRQPADVVLGSVEQATFGEFVLSLGNPCAAFVFDIGGGVQGMLDLSIDFSTYTVDRMFGGPGELRGAARALTQLERLAVKGIADRALALLGEVWMDHLAFEPTMIGFEAMPDALQLASKEDNVLVANIDVRTSNFSGLLTICLPLLALESFLQEKPAAVRQAARINPSERAEGRAYIERHMRQASLPVTARFPTIQLLARDVAKLQVGQIIHTGMPTDQPLEISVNGRRRFLGQPGQMRRLNGVRITEVCRPGTADGAARMPRARIA